MTALAHARIPATVDYHQLTDAQQADFDQLMEEADTAGPASYPGLMTSLRLLTGVTGEVRKCACPWSGCGCTTVFDANNPDSLVIEYGDGYNLGRHQCPRCADWHPATDAAGLAA
ncbi:hypothetical protein [Streptomyces chilikensis]|uniref:Uncharacterized protein n=1 Tax=Streptomyces chilikensis TaxID=1194079 RepID=A0ABV3ERL9_9ACTN